MASQMKAPPSTKKEIVDVPFAYRDLVTRYSPGGRYIDAQSDDDSPWVPFGPTAAIKHLSFDVRRNLFSNILWVKGPGTIGTHFHRGTITMVVLEGSVRYLEYDWVATPGGLILEVPGESHTLVTEHPDGVQAVRLDGRADRVLRRERRAGRDRRRVVDDEPLRELLQRAGHRDQPEALS